MTDQRAIVVTAVALCAVTLLGAGCGHLVGGAVASNESARGLRYYLPRTQFVLDQTVGTETPQVTVALMRVADLRYPHEIYLRQGLFSADVFDVQVNPHGLIVSVSGDAVDQSVESVKSVASFAVGLTSSLSRAALVAGAFQNRQTLLAAVGTDAPAGTCTADLDHLDALTSLVNLKEADLKQAAEGLARAGDHLREQKAKGQLTGAEEVAVTKARARLQVLLSDANACLKMIAQSRPALRSALEQVVDAAAPSVARTAIAATWKVDLASAALVGRTNTAAIQLLDGYLARTPAQQADELRELAAMASDPEAKGEFRQAATDVVTQFSLDSINEVQTAVAATGCTQCGAPATAGDVSTIGAIVGLMASSLDRLLEREQATDFRAATAADVLARTREAVSRIHRKIELALNPADGWEKASQRTRRLTFMKSDRAFEEETLLHETLRVRDRIHEFRWTRAELAAAATAAGKQAAAIREAQGGLSALMTLLEQRVAVETFLAQPVSSATARARERAQTELTKIRAEIERRRTVKGVTPAAVTRRLTPQVYWLDPYSDLPTAGDRVGSPGDVFVFIRPVAGKVR